LKTKGKVGRISAERGERKEREPQSLFATAPEEWKKVSVIAPLTGARVPTKGRGGESGVDRLGHIDGEGGEKLRRRRRNKKKASAMSL